MMCDVMPDVRRVKMPGRYMGKNHYLSDPHIRPANSFFVKSDLIRRESPRLPPEQRRQ